jgi:hypothetical protein
MGAPIVEHFLSSIGRDDKGEGKVRLRGVGLAFAQGLDAEGR